MIRKQNYQGIWYWCKWFYKNKSPRDTKSWTTWWARFGWGLMSPGKEADIKKLTCMKTSRDDNESLCRLDVLGATDIAREDITDHQDFKDQLREARMVGAKLNWCRIDVERQFYFTSKQQIGLFGKTKEFAAKFTKIFTTIWNTTIRYCLKIYNYSRVMIKLFKNNLLKD